MRFNNEKRMETYMDDTLAADIAALNAEHLRNTLEGGMKYDNGKPRFELLPFDVLEAVARIFTQGAKKYSDRNWERGLEYGRCYGAALRHLTDFWNAKLNQSDAINHDDGNESSLDHAITELMFLSAFEKRRMKSFDDRPGNKND